MNSAQLGMGVAGLALFFGLLLFCVALALWTLAKQNIFFTFVEEGRAKAILYNGAFKKFVMSYHDRIFRKDLPAGSPNALTRRSQPEDAWEVVDDPSPIGGTKWRLPFLGNIYWIGVPPFSSVYKYRFEWTSLEEVPKDDGSIHKVHRWKNQEGTTYVLVQADTYVSTISAAECGDNIPLDAVYVITGEVVNPYKALFKVQKWLETTQNLASASLRDYIGKNPYNKLRSATGPTGNDEVFDHMQGVRDQILKDYGFKITSVRFESVEPAGKLADDFIKATTRAVVAQEQAKADAFEGKGKADRATALYRAVAGIPGGKDMFVAEAIRDSKLTTFVNGQASGLVLSPPQPTQPAQPTPPQNAP